MRLKLVDYKGPTPRTGVIQAIEDKSPPQQPIIEFIAFYSSDKKDLCIGTLTQGGAMGGSIKLQ